MSGPTIFISAGEASGEHYGALLTAAIRQRLASSGQTAQFFGMGGARMEAAGLERVVRAEDVAVMGLTEVVRHLPRIYGEYRKLKRAIRERRPDVAVLIDFPEIHFRLAREFDRLHVPVIYFVSPQLWAWKKHRIRLVQRYVRRMLVIFPFEEPFYREHGVEAEFVGHPLAELPPPAISREQFAAENGLNPAKTWLGLLPGSRPREIRDHLPVMLEAARSLAMRGRAKREPGEEFEFPTPLAPTLSAAQRADVLALAKAQGGGVTVSRSGSKTSGGANSGMVSRMRSTPFETIVMPDGRRYVLGVSPGGCRIILGVTEAGMSYSLKLLSGNSVSCR